MQNKLDIEKISETYILIKKNNGVDNLFAKHGVDITQSHLSKMGKIPDEGLRDATRTSIKNIFRQQALVSDFVSTAFAITAIIAGPLTLAGLAAITAAALTFSKRATINLKEDEAMIMVVLHCVGHLSKTDIIDKMPEYSKKYHYDLPTENALTKSLEYLKKIGSIGQKSDGKYFLKEHVEIAV